MAALQSAFVARGTCSLSFKSNVSTQQTLQAQVRHPLICQCGPL